jgi:DNA-binding PadR family transcriptional regulator
MSPEEQNDRLEQMLRNAAPVLKHAVNGEIVVPQRVLQALNKVLDRKFPLVKELAAKEMETLILKVLSQKSMVGFDLITSLEKAHFKLKGGGDGAIYGLLTNLESSGYLRAEWRESSARMVKNYHLTDKGVGLLEKRSSAAVQLNTWTESVLSFNPSES